MDHRTLCLSLTGLLLAWNAEANNWPMFRGPGTKGIVEDQAVPQQWSGSQNLKWKVELPGPGSSSPIVWERNVYVTCYSGYGEDTESPGDPAHLKHHLLCFDRDTGQQLWQQTIASAGNEDPYKGFITDHGYASSTPVTNGERVFAFFGKSGVVAFDRNGQRLWQTNVGTESDPFRWGSGSSPTLCGDLVVVNAGNEGSAMIALRQSDGSEAWRVTETKAKNSWSTPLLVRAGDQEELIFTIPGRLFAVEPQTGQELWSYDSPIKRTVIPTAVQVGPLVISMGSRAGSAIAVKWGSRGELGPEQVVWEGKLPAGISTPVLVDGRLYWPSTGIVLGADPQTGNVLIRERLSAVPDAPAPTKGRRGSVYASPVAIGSRVYIVERSGVTHVYETQPDLHEVQVNYFAEDTGPFDGTPAVCDGQFFLRSARALYCIQKL